MKTHAKIDFTKLLGFNAVSADLSGPVDFRDDAIEARLGAKVGKPTLATVTLAEAGYDLTTVRSAAEED